MDQRMMDRRLPSFSLRGIRIGRTAGNLDSGIEAVGFAEEIGRPLHKRMTIPFTSKEKLRD